MADLNFTEEDNKAVEWCETNHPGICDEYKKIMMNQYITNLDTDGDVKLALTGLWFRMNDKIQRLKQLVIIGEPDTVGESLDDTFQDLSVYGIIAQIVKQKKFK